MLNTFKDKTGLTRNGFVTNYPSFRYWRKPMAEAGMAEKPLNIYAHIPFCTQRCGYCYYKTETLQASSRDGIDRYVDSLCREIEIATEHFHLAKRPVETVYFGGGTPTVLTKVQLAKIMDTLRANLTLTDGFEFSCEGEPVTLSQRKADIIQEAGVNRISLGIQSFDDEIISIAGRRDTEVQGVKAIEIAMNTGASVNIDLISGLAGETPEKWRHSVERAISTGVHSVTVYKLEIFANTPYYSQIRKDEIAIATDETELDYIRFASDAFQAAGYKPINFFTFTRDGGHKQRHTTNIWHGEDLYAFGTSAFGYMGGFGFQNTNAIHGYCETIEAGELPIYRGYAYNSLDRMVREVMLGMKMNRLDLKRLQKRHGFNLLRLVGSTVERLVDRDLVTVGDGELVLTERGMLYGDSVGRALGAALEELQDDEARPNPVLDVAEEALEAVPAS